VAEGQAVVLLADPKDALAATADSGPVGREVRRPKDQILYFILYIFFNRTLHSIFTKRRLFFHCVASVVASRSRLQEVFRFVSRSFPSPLPLVLSICLPSFLIKAFDLVVAVASSTL
jgi:hypothetical protein